MSNERARAGVAFPAGSNGEFDLPAELATVIARGTGCELWDVEGRHFYDFSIGWGSVLVGHARAEIVEAVTARLPMGANFAYVNDASLALAEELIRLSPACDAVRFCASGTEATMYCVRLARAFRDKPAILKFEGAYHGAHDVGVTSLFPANPPDWPAPDLSTGVADPAAEQHVLVAPFNNLEETRRIIASHADRLAAVIVEPFHRCISPVPGFLTALRELTQQHGVLLIFDEVVTGFRLAYGGAQEYYGVVPDLVSYGKALGGGLPIGAFGGRRELMDLVREDRLGRPDYVWSASTLGGNPLSSAAALAALGVFSGPGVYEHLHHLGRYLRDGMTRVLAARDIAAQVIGDGPLAQVVFSTEAVHDYRSAARGDRARARAVMLGLFRKGIFLNPMGTKLYLSLVHTEEVCEEFLTRFDEVLAASK